MLKGTIAKVSGPVVVAEDIRGAKMYDVVRVGKEKLLGEIIQLNNDTAIIQVYEDTTGLKPGDPVISTEMPLSVQLGPGLLTSIYDGIARPLQAIAQEAGDYITRGIEAPPLDKERSFDIKAVAKVGDEVTPGTIIAETPETDVITHKIMVPPGVSGKITKINSGKKKGEDVIATIKTKKGNHDVKLYQEWPVRLARPITTKYGPSEPLVTGQRVFDSFFTLAKGGAAAIPGPFGAGKTVSQHQLAKWSDAEIIVYIGCGERGNEMTEVLQEFPELIDPKTGKSLMERTILIANTSNMPVAAREASIYTGITIAEYYRDMGYNVALMADSTSRWAEAMREISSRLEEMPGEEGYPAYLASKVAQFYERGGKVENINGTKGSVSVIGAVSPAGGDFSEPVTQNTLRIAKVFWALDASLAYKRHFPSVNWLTSYSLYFDDTADYFTENIAEDFNEYRRRAMQLLQKEAELKEIVQLVGPDALPENDKAIIFTTKSLREDFLQQNAFHEVDSFCSLEKQYTMLKLILDFFDKINEACNQGVKVNAVQKLSEINERIARLKYEKEYEKEAEEIVAAIDQEMKKLVEQAKL